MQTRRDFIARAGGTAAIAVLSPSSLAAAAAGPRGSAAIFRSGRFSQGVMSGDPKPREITLWTKLNGVSGTGSLRLEVARDRGFRRLVTRASLTVSPDSDHVVKVRLRGLDRHERYYYRFETRTTESAVGRFTTALPADSNQPVRFGVFSCQEYAHGFYNAHTLLAREDLDFVVNLGDYIYVEDYYSPDAPKSPYSIETGGKAVRRDTVGPATTLDQIRRKYDLYRSDAALRAMHQKFPMVSVWDDHEVANDFAGAAFDRNRIAAGARAYAENMPSFAVPTTGRKMYQRLRFGKNVELFMLDERSFRAAQPCNNVGQQPPCAEIENPRSFLGETQAKFLNDRLAASTAAWKLIGNEVPVSVLRAPTKDAYLTFDSWQGYPVERRRLLEHIKAKGIKDVAFLTGDIHVFYAADVKTDDGTYVGAEFTTGSITSENFGENGLGLGFANDANPSTPAEVYSYLYSINPDVDLADLDRHGYLLVEATTRQLDVRYRGISTIKTRSTLRVANKRWVLPRGARSIKPHRK